MAHRLTVVRGDITELPVAAIAVDTIRSTPTAVNEVTFVAFDQETVDAYADFL